MRGSKGRKMAVLWSFFACKSLKMKMVRDTGLEPVTSTVSR